MLGIVHLLATLTLNFALLSTALPFSVPGLLQHPLQFAPRQPSLSNSPSAPEVQVKLLVSTASDDPEKPMEEHSMTVRGGEIVKPGRFGMKRQSGEQRVKSTKMDC